MGLDVGGPPSIAPVGGLPPAQGALPPGNVNQAGGVPNINNQINQPGIGNPPAVGGAAPAPQPRPRPRSRTPIRPTSRPAMRCRTSREIGDQRSEIRDRIRGLDPGIVSDSRIRFFYPPSSRHSSVA